MPLGVLYIHALTMPYSNWCIRMPMCVWCVGRIVTYRRGAFGVARFDRQGNSQEPQNVKRATSIRASRLFLCLNESICFIVRCL